jgi:hypothetical protein
VTAESIKFADLVALWARERLVHEVLVARELAHGIVVEGLRFQSTDPTRLHASEAFRGYPFVGYCAREGAKPVILRADALEHLLAVMRAASDPSTELLADTRVTRLDFRHWLIHTGRPLPAFWFGPEERFSDR